MRPARDCDFRDRIRPATERWFSSRPSQRSSAVASSGWFRISSRFALLPTLERQLAVGELATRLTIIDEGESRFFTSPDFDICWADIETNEPIDENEHVVSGRIYCIAPINEVNGSATISVADIVFSGRIDWSAS